MKISEINIYPIKSLSGISVKSSIVEEKGLQNDRRFMIVDANNDFITQREFSKMVVIETKDLGESLEVSADGFGKLKIQKQFEKTNLVKVRIWRSLCEAIVAKDETNEWFSEVLETKCKLVQMPLQTRRQINERFNRGDEIVSFADGYPLLLIGENSLADLNSKLEKRIPMNRFRPNIVVSGSEAFAEDKWKKINIGNTVFRVTKPCARCVITTIDQKTGISDVKEPLKTLATYRRSRDVIPDAFEEFGLGRNDVLFGQNLVAENFGGVVKLGDDVKILELA
ncbi:MAG: MOSC domain-containing protein [Pyrinomonadaceae bacterium]